MVQVTFTTSTGVTAQALVDMFAAEPELERIALEVDGEAIGVVTRARLAQLWQQTNTGVRDPNSPGVGAGDGASLPGRALAFSVFRFGCASCGAEVRRLFVEGPPPHCPDGHGPLDRVA